MNNIKMKRVRWQRRKAGVRKRVLGTSERPRLTVYRSLTHIYAQLINDIDGRTLVAANSAQDGMSNGSNVEGAKAVGTKLAERAKSAGVTAVAFDRNGFRYHGRVRALADAAREGGLQF